MQRRHFLKLGASGLLASIMPGPSCAAHAESGALARTDHSRTVLLDRGQAFDLAWLKQHARTLAAQPYRSRRDETPPSVTQLSWEQYQSIRYRAERALWNEPGSHFQARLFHVGPQFRDPVRIFELDHGNAVERGYDPSLFDYGSSGLSASSFSHDAASTRSFGGYAGFRVFHDDLQRDVAAFLGASYFRAVGSQWQYGLSARGLAIDTALDRRPEEFPVFTSFWLEHPAAGSGTVIVYALLDSPSITGAYRFAITPGEPLLMDVDATLYPRQAIERLGIAPLTSMFQCGENDRRMGYDYRPEIHDSDGLAIWTGTNEWIWRPLCNPEQLRFNAYSDKTPRGFGLLQRDRNFQSYQDDAVFYDRRPSAWIEPKQDWGAGSIELVEIPTIDETNDNIVMFWNPAQPVTKGQELSFGYRLYWGARAPVQPPLAQTVATRTGLGGVVGVKRTHYSLRFAVDFASSVKGLFDNRGQIEPVINASRGKLELISSHPIAGAAGAAGAGYRALFDLAPDDDSAAPIDLRMFLRGADGQPLTETWLYQWTPPPASARTLF